MKALGELYTRYSDLVFGVSMKYLQSMEDSEDMVMDVFEVLTRKLKTQDVSNFKSWLFVLVKHQCLGVLRQRKRNHGGTSEAMFMHLASPEHLNDMKILEHKESVLRECISKLADHQQETIRLFYFEHFPYSQISAEMGIHIDKVRSYIQNGRRNLKKCLHLENLTDV